MGQELENPWKELPDSGSRILKIDQSVIESFAGRYADKDYYPDYKVQDQLLPEPFIGNPSARVYVLGLNPGYTPEDDEWHVRSDFPRTIANNLIHRPSDYPFYFLNPKFEKAPGSTWWLQRCKWLLGHGVCRHSLANNMFCVELFPYHSRKYKPIPKNISPNRLVPSSDYSIHLVEKARREKKPIIAMRAFVAWCGLIPELKVYKNLFRLNSPQNVALSPGNMPGFGQLIREFEAGEV